MPRYAAGVVEHRIVDPQVLEIPEEPKVVGRRAGAGCLICGEWVDADGDDAYALAIGRVGSVELDAVAHGACLRGVVAPSFALPV